MSLQTKVIIFGGVGFLVLFGLLAFLGVRALEESTQRTFDERVVTAQMVAQGVDQTLQKALDDLEQFAIAGSVDLEDGDLAPEIATLNDLYRFSRVFTLLFLLDNQGKVLYTQPKDPGVVGSDFTPYPSVGKTLGDRQTHISSASRADASENPVFSLSIPIFSGDNELVGVVGGNIDLSEGGIGSLIQPIRLGETAYAEVVSEEGLVMAATKKDASAAFEETEYAEHFATLISRGEATQETCYRCHETESGVQRQDDVLAFAPLKTVPGGVAIRQLKTEALAPTRRLERDMLVVGASIFAVGLILTWMGTRALVRPVSQLTAASQRISRGDLDTAISATRKDELGTLASTLEQMRVRLKESLAEKEERAQESEGRAQALSALNAIAATVSRSLELEQILDDSLDKVLQTMHMEAGGIFLKDEETGKLILKTRRAMSEAFLVDIANLKIEPGFAASAVAFSTEILSPEGSAGKRLRTLVNVPLTSKDRLLGLMTLATTHRRQFSSQETELLTAIGHQIGMGIDNGQLFRQAQRQEMEAQALYRIGVEVSRLLDLEKILSSVADNARRLLRAEVSSLALLDEDSHEVYISATSGPLSDAFRRIRVKVGQGIMGKVVSMGQSVVSEDYLSDPTFVHTVEVDSLVRENGLRGHLAVPLKIGERVFGSLIVAMREQHKFTEREVDLLNQLAHQAAVATENARLYRQVQDLAILEERDRIAREMHDGLGQVLGYLIIKARAVEDFLSSAQTAPALEETREIKKVARDAYEEVREGILGLRASVSPEDELIPTLEKYLVGFQSQSGIAVTLEVGDERATRFPSRVAVQLVRVIQEALANVRKHARATSVQIRFELDGDQAKIIIEDNGIGFDPSQLEQPDHLHFGLQTMKERAESVGGAFQLKSAPGKGTQAIVILPLSSEGSN